MMEDDIYKGLFIPAGTITIDNTWCAAIVWSLSDGWLSVGKGNVS